MTTQVSSLTELVHALAAGQPQTIELHAFVTSPESLIVPPGCALVGADKARCGIGFSNGDGLGLTGDNRIADLVITAAPACRAIYACTGRDDMGTVTLTNLTVTGQVSVIVRQGTRHLTVVADAVDVVACDARRYVEQPQKYGVNVLQGAFTVYNFNPDADSRVTATLTNLAAGREHAPVLGSGVFVSGFGDSGGQVTVSRLTTGAVYATGLLPFGVADVITAGVFVVFGVHADEVRTQGEVVTYGVNDMVLDNWGRVTRWTAAGRLVSYGPSGIGFVNFGTVDTFAAEREIVTYGLGSRGFNQYDGTVGQITFASITTHGDGAIGIQVSQPVGSLEVTGDVTTYGSLGTTLVKGVLQELPAEAVSIKRGGAVRRLAVGGSLVTHGARVTTYAVDGGAVDALQIGGDVVATGADAVAVAVRDGGRTPLAGVKARAAAGRALVEAGGTVTDRTGFSGAP